MKYFFIVMLSVILGAYFYTFLRLWQMIPAGNALRPVTVVFAVLVTVSLFAGALAGDSMPVWLVTPVYKIGTAWFFITVYLLVIFLAIDLLKLTPLPVKQYVHGSWLGLGVLTALVTVIMTAGYVNYLNKERIDIPVKIDKYLARELKIVVMSDLHLGYSINNREFEGWVELINKEEPDVVLFAGDIIDNSLRPLRNGGFADTFRKINAKYGVYACMGNHEYISGGEESFKFLTDAGVTVLRDSAALVDDMFYVVGREDYSRTGRKLLKELTATLDLSKPVIVIDHQPHDLAKAEEQGTDLHIFGHTHRGQVWPLTWITDAMFKVSHGYVREGSGHFFVSSGIGLWGGKFRIGSRSDYAVITVTGK